MLLSFSTACRTTSALCTLFLLCPALETGAQKGDSTPLRQALAEQAPEARTRALETFLLTRPEAGDRTIAQRALLKTYLDSFPDRQEQIHTVASEARQAAMPGVERWTEEVSLANELADAGGGGVDLPDAATWATDAVTSMTEPAYTRAASLRRTQYHLPATTLRTLHRQYTHDRAAALAALANVRLQQHDPKRAASLLSEAAKLAPDFEEVVRLQAEIAYVQGRKPEALSKLIHAETLAPLPPFWHERELELFHELTGQGPAELQNRIDQDYDKTVSAIFRLSPRSLPLGGHPALLELFTGSDCIPCAGPDLAVDSLLHTYGRKDLIAIEFDEHIPTPDPLATEDTVARSILYNVGATPTAFLDGQPLMMLGSSRADVENIVIGLADQLEDTAALPSGLQLKLSVDMGDDEKERIQAHVMISRSSDLVSTGEETTSDTSLQRIRRATLHVALVQDDLRYTGRNGVRFHRMVVRTMQSGLAFSALAQPLLFVFDPATVAHQNEAYLKGFEQSNELFGAFHFPLTQFPLDPTHLALVAWIEDPATRHILQSSFITVPSHR